METTTVRVVTEQELETLKVPATNGVWRPRSHKEILHLATDAISKANLQVERVQLLVASGAHKFWGLLEIDQEIAHNKNLVIGVTNSTNKSLAQGLFYGARERGDDELLLSSDIETRKHTINSIGHFNETMKGLPESATSYISSTRELIRCLLQREMHNEEAESILLRVFEQGIIWTRNLPVAIKNWRDAEIKNAFALLCGIDSSIKNFSVTNPTRYFEKSISLRNFFEELPKKDNRHLNYQI